MTPYRYMISYTIQEAGTEVRKYALWAESPSEARMKFQHIFCDRFPRILSVVEA